MSKINIREAVVEDAPLILSLIKEIAEYEKLSHEVVATTELIRENFFGKNRVAYSLIAEIDDKPAGYAVYFYTYSTFVGRPGIWVEDLFLKPEYRGTGVGKRMLIEIAKIAVERNCGRMEGAVLDWNKPSIDFYLSIGAKPMDEWTIYRLTEEALTKFAACD